MDITVIIALITALSAIIAPFLTAIVNNRHQLRIRELDFYQKKKIETIEEYLKATSEYLATLNSLSESRYNSVAGRIFLYTPQSLWPKLDELNACITHEGGSNKNFTQAHNLFIEIGKNLSEYLAMK